MGCNSAYQYRQLNEKRIDMSNISRMSILSRAILKNAPYDYIKNKRFENFNLASDLYSSMIKSILIYISMIIVFHLFIH